MTVSPRRRQEIIDALRRGTVPAPLRTLAGMAVRHSCRETARAAEVKAPKGRAERAGGAGRRRRSALYGAELAISISEMANGRQLSVAICVGASTAT